MIAANTAPRQYYTSLYMFQVMFTVVLFFLLSFICLSVYMRWVMVFNPTFNNISVISCRQFY
jgi:hypothetical protein